MKIIPSSIINKVRLEMGKYSDLKISEEASRFLRRQPSLVQFLKEFTDEFGPDIQQLALYLAFVICRIFRTALNREIPKLSWSFCYNCLLWEHEIWRESHGVKKPKNKQPYIVQYLGFLIEREHTGLFKDDNEKASFLIVMRSVVCAFEKASSRL